MFSLTSRFNVEKQLYLVINGPPTIPGVTHVSDVRSITRVGSEDAVEEVVIGTALNGGRRWSTEEDDEKDGGDDLLPSER